METQSKALKWSLVIGIVIVTNLFFNYALSLIYQSPTYENFCPTEQVNQNIDNQNACVSQGGQWNESAYNVVDTTPTSQLKGNMVPVGYCNLQFTCQNNYEAAQNAYDRNVFITLVILGVLCVAAGTFLKGNAVMGIALSISGVLSFVIASMRYWSSADNLIKVIILAIALALLIWMAIKKFKNIQQASTSNERIQS
jgi:hypothetical protein